MKNDSDGDMLLYRGSYPKNKTGNRRNVQTKTDEPKVLASVRAEPGPGSEKYPEA